MRRGHWKYHPCGTITNSLFSLSPILFQNYKFVYCELFIISSILRMLYPLLIPIYCSICIVLPYQNCAPIQEPWFFLRIWTCKFFDCANRSTLFKLPYFSMMSDDFPPLGLSTPLPVPLPGRRQPQGKGRGAL